MSTIAYVARVLFPADQRDERRPLPRRDGSALSQLLSVCFALVPLGTMMDVYWRT